MKYSFVYVCEKRSFIYYDIPKCASSTIRKEVFDSNNECSLHNPDRALSEYFKFTFVRNPWARMVSNWKMFTNQPYRIRQLKSMTTRDLSDFEDFVHFASETKNHHWQPQVLYLPDDLDFIGRVETFDTDFKKLLTTIGEPPRQVSKSNVTSKGKYWGYYTPALADFVAEMYAEDIKRFGYTFGSK